jgi:hypothetical protein
VAIYMDKLSGERRQFRPSEGRGYGTEAQQAQAAWQRAHGLYKAVLGHSLNRIDMRVAINDFLDELKAQFGETELKRYRLYDLLRGRAGAGEAIDFPDNRIQNFLDRLLLRILPKNEVHE